MSQEVKTIKKIKRNNYDILNEEIPKEIDDIKIFQNEWNFYIHKGCYYYTEYKGKRTNEIRISNFVMDILYHLTDGTNNTKRIIKIQKDTGKIYLKEVFANEMSNDKFEVILKSASCTFMGSSYQLKSIFDYLMRKETTAKTIDNLGYQKNFDIYAYADSLINSNNKLLKINELGIIRDKNELYYLPAFSSANIDNDYYSHDRTFKYKQGKIDFAEWSKLIYDTFGVNGAIGVNYAIASIFRDIVFDELKFFPFVFLFGSYGTGKTSFIESILHLFGSHTIGTALSNVTTSGLSRETSQRNNSIFYYKEFTTDNAQIANPFILNAYDGSGRTMGQKSMTNKTVKFLPQSGILFDGNYLPIQKDAVFSRLILLIFEENNFSEKQKAVFGKLAKEKEKGLSQIVKELLQYRDLFKQNFKRIYTYYVSSIDKNLKYKNIPSRLKNHASIIISIYILLKEKLNFPYSAKVLVSAVLDYMEQQFVMLEEIEDVANFWKSAEYYKSKGVLVEDRDYVKENFVEYGYIFIKYDAFYSAYIRYCNENNFNKVDKPTLRALLTSKANKSFKPNVTQGSRKTIAITKYSIGSTYRFEYSVIKSGLKINNIELFL